MRKYARIRKFVRDLIPDIPVVRYYLSAKMEKRVRDTLISEADVIWGEQNSANKKEILAKYREKLGNHIGKIQKQIEEALATGIKYQGLSNDELENIKRDMQFCYIAYGFLPGEYEAFGLENKGIEERKTYVADQQRRIYRYKMNDILAANLFIDKGKTYEIYKPYFHRSVISISKPSDFDKFHRFVNEHDEFVLKNAIDSLGKGVSLVKSSEIEDERAFFQACIRKGTHVLEERIVQSEFMAAFNESSVNTVRAISFVTKNDIVVPYCILRMGRAGSFVDNGGNGGVIACIDYETGRIITDGYDECGNVYQAHPDTGTVFQGYQLPDWAALKTMCTEVALKVSKFKMIGWDFAHTADGWVMVEGNDSPHLIGQQMILGGLKETMDDLLKKMDL